MNHIKNKKDLEATINDIRNFSYDKEIFSLYISIKSFIMNKNQTHGNL